MNVSSCIAVAAVLLGGLGEKSAPETRPDLNGTRVRAPGGATVYLVVNGYRRAVPDIPAYEALFRDWECIVEDLDVESIREGDPLGGGSGLVRLPGDPVVYFVDGVTRRAVASTQVMDKYAFSWDRVRDVDPKEMDRWPEGPKLR